MRLSAKLDCSEAASPAWGTRGLEAQVCVSEISHGHNIEMAQLISCFLPGPSETVLGSNITNEIMIAFSITIVLCVMTQLAS